MSLLAWLKGKYSALECEILCSHLLSVLLWCYYLMNFSSLGFLFPNVQFWKIGDSSLGDAMFQYSALVQSDFLFCYFSELYFWIWLLACTLGILEFLNFIPKSHSVLVKLQDKKWDDCVQMWVAKPHMSLSTWWAYFIMESYEKLVRKRNGISACFFASSSRTNRTERNFVTGHFPLKRSITETSRS